MFLIKFIPLSMVVILSIVFQVNFQSSAWCGATFCTGFSCSTRLSYAGTLCPLVDKVSPSYFPERVVSFRFLVWKDEGFPACVVEDTLAFKHGSYECVSKAWDASEVPTLGVPGKLPRVPEMFKEEAVGTTSQGPASRFCVSTTVLEREGLSYARSRESTSCLVLLLKAFSTGWKVKLRRRSEKSRTCPTCVQDEDCSGRQEVLPGLRVTRKTLCDGGFHSATCGMKKFSEFTSENSCSKGLCGEEVLTNLESDWRVAGDRSACPRPLVDTTKKNSCGSNLNPRCCKVYGEPETILIKIKNCILIQIVLIFYLSWMLGNGAHKLNGNIKKFSDFLKMVFMEFLVRENQANEAVEETGISMLGTNAWNQLRESEEPSEWDLNILWAIAISCRENYNTTIKYAALNIAINKICKQEGIDPLFKNSTGLVQFLKSGIKAAGLIPISGFDIGVEVVEEKLPQKNEEMPFLANKTPMKKGKKESIIPLSFDLEKEVEKRVKEEIKKYSRSKSGASESSESEEKKPKIKKEEKLKDILPKENEKVEIIDLEGERKVVDMDKNEEARKKLHKNIENLEKLATQQAVNQDFEESSKTLKILKDMKKLVKNVKTQQKTLYKWIKELKDKIVADRLQIIKTKFKAVRLGVKTTAWGEKKTTKKAMSLLAIAEKQYDALEDHARQVMDAELLLDVTNFREERRIMASEGENLHDFRKWLDLEKMRNRLARKAAATMRINRVQEVTIGGLVYEINDGDKIHCRTEEGRSQTFIQYMKEKRKSKEKKLEVSLAKICLYCGSSFRTMKRHHKLCEECASHLRSGWKEEEEFLIHELDGNKNPISKTSGYEVLDGKKKKAGKRGTAPRYTKKQASDRTRGIMKKCRTCAKEFEALQDWYFWCDTCRINHNKSKIKAMPRKKKCEDCQIEITVTNDKHTRCTTCHKTWVTKNPRTGKKNYHNFKKVVNWEEQNFESPESQERLKKLGWVKPSGSNKTSQ